MDNKARLLALFAAIAAAASLRLLPHPPNFSPIAAMGLFSGAFVGKRALAFFAPLAALFASDLLLGFYGEMIFVYASVAAIVLIGWVIQSRTSILRVGAAAVAGSVLFYAVTNFGVWAMGTMYPHTLQGLAACYVAAIPFFQNTIAGDLFFATLLFGGFALAERLLPAIRQPQRTPLAA